MIAIALTLIHLAQFYTGGALRYFIVSPSDRTIEHGMGLCITYRPKSGILGCHSTLASGKVHHWNKSINIIAELHTVHNLEDCIHG